MLTGYWQYWVPFLPAILLLLALIVVKVTTRKGKREDNLSCRLFVLGGLYFPVGIILLIFMPEPDISLIYIVGAAIVFIIGLIIRNTKWDHKYQKREKNGV